jgi:HEAT repeat protein
MAALTRTLASEDPDVRAQAVLFLGEFADERGRRLLQSMVHDPSPRVRSIAIEALGRTMNLDVVATLIVALGDPVIEVRRAAAKAISRITGRQLSPSVDPRELAELKQWWTETRVAELAGATSSECDRLLEIPSVPWRQST